MLLCKAILSLICIDRLCALSKTSTFSKIPLGRQRSNLGVPYSRNTFVAASRGSGEEEEVEVGSREYFKGFFESPLNEDTDPRGDGLKQTLALAGNTALILIILTAFFLKANGVF
jgi:hypothetical protein